MWKKYGIVAQALKVEGEEKIWAVYGCRLEESDVKYEYKPL